MPLIPTPRRQRIAELRESQVYRVSSRTTRAAQRSPVSAEQNVCCPRDSGWTRHCSRLLGTPSPRLWWPASTSQVRSVRDVRDVHPLPVRQRSFPSRSSPSQAAPELLKLPGWRRPFPVRAGEGTQDTECQGRGCEVLARLRSRGGGGRWGCARRRAPEARAQPSLRGARAGGRNCRARTSTSAATPSGMSRRRRRPRPRVRAGPASLARRRGRP